MDIGDVHYDLTVVECNVGKQGHYTLTRCICICGTEVTVRASNLKSGNTKSCGCRRKRTKDKRGRVYDHPLYKTWNAMHSRCYDSNHKSSKYYSEKGITVCDRWFKNNQNLDGFFNFIEDMGERPEGFTLDRIDGSLGYSPENCKWSCLSEQQKNQRRTSPSTSIYRGVMWDSERDVWQANIKSEGQAYFIGRFDDEIKAAKAYDEKARELGFKESWINFPIDDN